jgi:predicted Rossmann fold flavoprotein
VSADTFDVIVIGAGAAGLTTAIFARRFAPERTVLVLDGAKKPGAKILVSGGSRCNVTNTEVSERDFWGGRRTMVRRVLRSFTAAETAAFFRDLGVTLHEEADGKLFPDSNRSRDVLNALLGALDASGAELRADHRVLAVEPSPCDFRIVTTRGELRARSVVVATGGQSLPKTGSDGAGYGFAVRAGHSIVATTPALTPLVLDDERSFHREVAGASHDVELAIWIDGAIATRLAGPLLWTHVGASGPVAMNASRHWLRAQVDGRSVTVTLSCAPGESLETVDARLRDAASASPKGSVHAAVSTFVPASVAAALLGRLAIDPKTPLAHLARDDRRRAARALVEWPLPIAGTRGYSHAEATAGGVALDEIDPATMESRVCAGLFFVGEVLDVDGRIGGFNFQWAWSSAFVAGRALARGRRAQ